MVICEDGFTLDGLNMTGEGTVAISAHGVRDLTIKNVFVNGYDVALELVDCENVVIDFCGFALAKSAAMIAKNSTISVKDTYFMLSGQGADLHDSNVRMENSIFSDNISALSQRGGLLRARDCIEWRQIEPSRILGDAEFDDGVGFDEDSIVLA